MNNKKLLIAGLVVIVVLLGWFFYKKSGVSQEKSAIKIGASFPLAGEAASLGEGGRAGADLALQEVNESGGVNGRPIEIIYEDDKCNKDGINTITKLVNVDKVAVIIGPLCSASAGPGLPVAQKALIPTIFWASAPHLSKIGDYMFRTYPSDSFQGRFAAQYIFNTLAKKRAAVVYVKNDWGQGIRDVFINRFKELGGEVVYDEGVSQDARDLKTILAKVKAVNPDVIYYPTYPAVGIIGLKQMKELGMKTPVLGGDGFESKEMLVPEAEGVLYTVAKFQNPDEFKQKVKLRTGKDSNLVTPLAYDAVKIFAQIMNKVGTDQKAIRDELAKLSYRDGIASSLIEFDQDGDLKSAEFEVKIIKGGTAVPYSK